MQRIKHGVAVGAVGLAALAAGGGAYAASKSGGEKADQQAYLSDVAKRLGVSTQRLTDALKAARDARIDARVKEGRLTPQRAAALKARPVRLMRSGAHGMRRGRHMVLQAAADYLGLTIPQLHQQRRAGHSLADVAKSRGRSVSSLEAAIVKAFAGTKLTDARKQAIAERIVTATPRAHAAAHRFGP